VAKCPIDGSLDLDLVKVLPDGRRLAKCLTCGHEWVIGEAKPPEPHPAEGSRPVTFDHDDDGYHAWIAAWPRGYVVNRTRGFGELKLHRADCHSITTLERGMETFTCHEYVKDCSTDRVRLRNYLGCDLPFCGQCM
jgi:hypothetical protein